MKQHDYHIRAMLLALLLGTVVELIAWSITTTALRTWFAHIGKLGELLVTSFGYFYAPMAITLIIYEKLRPPPFPDGHTRCGNCGCYLKGLYESRCPECGQTI